MYAQPTIAHFYNPSPRNWNTQGIRMHASTQRAHNCDTRPGCHTSEEIRVWAGKVDAHIEADVRRNFLCETMCENVEVLHRRVWRVVDRCYAVAACILIYHLRGRKLKAPSQGQVARKPEPRPNSVSLMA